MISTDFLTSTRFWKLGIVALVQLIAQYSPDFKPVSDAILVWLGGSVLIRTVDREVDRITTKPTPGQ